MPSLPSIYIRKLRDRAVVRSIPYTAALAQRARDKEVDKLTRQLDTTEFFVDTSEVDLAIAKRRR